MRTIILLWGVLWGLATSLQGQIVVSGLVEDARSGARLGYVAVTVPGTAWGDLTNAYGFFSLTLPTGTPELCFRVEGYQAQCVGLDTTAFPLRVRMMPVEPGVETTLDTVRIEAQMSKSEQAGHLVVPIEQLAAMPALLGEADPLKAMQLLPGIQFGLEGTTGLYIRGGSPDQNLILLDDIPVYNISHLFGFVSLFPAEALSSVSLYRGGFPARYGGRLSSVIELKTREGNFEEWERKLSLGIVTSSATLAGPLVKGKSALFLSARRTWLDLFVRPISRASFQRQGIDGGLGYGFYDVIGKAAFQLSPRDRLVLSVYGGQDRNDLRIASTVQDTLVNTYEGLLKWGNLAASARYSRVFGPKLFGYATLGYTQYTYQSGAVLEAQPEGFPAIYSQYVQRAGIRDAILKQVFEYNGGPRSHWEMGLEGTYQQFQPDVQLFQEAGTVLEDTSLQSLTYHNLYAALFLSHRWVPHERMSVQTGMRGEWTLLQAKPFFSLQPRVNAELTLAPRVQLRAAYSFVQQYLHLLSSSGLALPADLWVPATPEIPPGRAHQGVLGVSFALPWGMEAVIEAYGKSMQNLLEYREGSSFFGNFESWEEKVTLGRGRAYGLEFFLHRPHGRWNGWISYTLSRVRQTFPEINQGQPFPARFDRPHNLNLNLSYALRPERRRLSLTWMYVSGSRFTAPTLRYNTPFDLQGFINGTAQNPITLQNLTLFGYGAFSAGGRHNLSLSPFHKLDLAFEMTATRKGRQRTWTLGIYNLYGRRNALYAFFDGRAIFNERTNQRLGNGRILEYSFLIMIPSVSYQIAF